MAAVVVFLTLIFLFSLVANRAQRSIFTGPMLFTLAGILIYLVATPSDSAALSLPTLTDPLFMLMGEITLAVVLFSDATHISFRQVRQENQLALRLLGIGMPLTIIAGSAAAAVIFAGVSIWEAAILGTILAPTDASLGTAVFNSKLIPLRIRQALTVEAGLNDGLSMPFLILFIGLSGVELAGHTDTWAVYAAQQIGFGALGGLAVGLLGGSLMVAADRRQWTEAKSRQLAMVVLAIMAWLLAGHTLHGNGFIAAFVAGAAFRYTYRQAHEQMTAFDESWGDFLTYFIFFYFGLVAAPLLPEITGSLWLYGILSLTLVRMAPVAIALIGARLRPETVLLMGWFGPRGLASVVLGLIYVETATDVPSNSFIVLAMIAAVMLSVIAHGASAYPATKLYARRVGNSEAEITEPAVDPAS